MYRSTAGSWGASHWQVGRQPTSIYSRLLCFSKNCANGAVVQKILDRVLSTYDVRLRPNFGGKQIQTPEAFVLDTLGSVPPCKLSRLYTSAPQILPSWVCQALQGSTQRLPTSGLLECTLYIYGPAFLCQRLSFPSYSLPKVLPPLRNS